MSESMTKGAIDGRPSRGANTRETKDLEKNKIK